MTTIRWNNSIIHGLVDGFQSRVEGAVAMTRRILAARRSRAVTQRLLTHDDRMLTDIGITRNDVEQALAIAWDGDPAVALAEIRRRRMQADRQRLATS